MAQELDEGFFHDATGGGGAAVQMRVDAGVFGVAALARGGGLDEGIRRARVAHHGACVRGGVAATRGEAQCENEEGLEHRSV